jgi:hypothetical protein
MINSLKNTDNGLTNTKAFLVLVSLILVFISGLPKAAQAASASFYFSPASGTFFVGSTFDVSIFVNTGGEDVNAVEVNVKFDPKKIQVANPTAGKSFIEVWVSQPTFSNTQGTMSFLGGVPSPGINTSSGLVSTVTFRVMSPGETTILFNSDSKVLLNDSHGTNILTSLGRGVYNFLIPPPEGPRLFSTTHPDQNKWYKNNNPTFSWEKEEGVTDFSYNLDEDPVGTPDNNSEGGEITSISYSDVKDGIWYFHIKAKKANVWGGISHYLVRIDATPPAAFTPVVDPSPETTEKQPLVSFMTTDALSGLAYYQLKYIDITPGNKEEEVGFFTEVSTPYKLPALKVGRYLVVVRAYDEAGNWREGTVKIQIFPRQLFFTKKGICYKNFVFPWWAIILILIIIIMFFIIYVWLKNRKLLQREKRQLSEMEKKLADRRKKYWDSESGY